jgi:azurin
LHNVGYYTLNQIPSGEKLDVNKLVADASGHQHVNVNTATPKKKSAKATKDNKAAAKKPTSLVKRTTTMPASWTNGPDHSITIGTKPGLKYDLEIFEVKAGSKIKITFNNNDDMLHNLVVVLPNTAVQVGEEAINLGLEGSQKHYIPDTEKVLYHTNLLQPETSESIYFEAPDEAGDYTYVCTFPGHAYVMQGIMKVIK